ncbi:uncharacterized protein F4822DRAFT_425987 [Hypoxylon trugodes]|uniref:uncharacterized protein n=1 Tax=Hypoxylon trugodes TaxID=326681 RepID=UPI00219DE5B0|nr:uncharacterized protein F4822DRAFT_425987 [Hypoxylon trugodes]KAI1392779.1 hypothetical protein F4822DRAFT_425987 [Hypoxylon trugodes]
MAQTLARLENHQWVIAGISKGLVQEGSIGVDTGSSTSNSEDPASEIEDQVASLSIEVSTPPTASSDGEWLWWLSVPKEETTSVLHSLRPGGFINGHPISYPAPLTIFEVPNDQHRCIYISRHPGCPNLYGDYVKDASQYVSPGCLYGKPSKTAWTMVYVEDPDEDYFDHFNQDYFGVMSSWTQTLYAPPTHTIPIDNAWMAFSV